MDKDEINSAIHNVILPIARASGIELIEMRYHRRREGRSILRIFIDKEGGVTIDDCERFSREVEAELDVEDLIAETYVLEVSSPGLDRSLRRIEDYMKNIGKLANLTTSTPFKNMRFFIGRITKVEGDSIILILENGEELSIPFMQISKANLRIEL